MQPDTLAETETGKQNQRRLTSMPKRRPKEKKQQAANKSTRFVYGGGLWMDEMVDKMMEQASSGYVGFHCTYKKDLGKQTPGR
jgi:hypothetical protein